MNDLIAAIVDDDRTRVKALLAANAGLATSLFDKARLYRTGIFHWIYVGDTALHLAAAGYRVEIAQLLLGAGADPNAVMNHRRSSPLHYASDGYVTGPAWNPQRQVMTLKSLLDAGGDVRAQDRNGATALHRAVRTRCAAAVRFLLAAGSDPMLRNKSGSLPFHLAVQNTGRGGSGEEAAKVGQRQIIETFLSIGLSASVKDGNGRSVLDCAKSAWIRDLLTGASANPTGSA